MPRTIPLPPVIPQNIETQSLYGLIDGFNDSDNQVFLKDSEISNGLNTVIDEDETWTARKGTEVFGNFLGNTTKVLGGFEYYKPSSGARTKLLVYHTDLYKYASSEWSAQSQSLTTAKEGEFVNGNDKVYFTNGTDAVRNYDGSSWTSMANFPIASATSSDIGKGLEFYKERIITWNTDNNPIRVYYSDAGAETIGTSNFFDVFEPVIGCVKHFEYLLVFTESEIYRIGEFVFSGAAYDPDKLQRMPTNYGAVSRRSIKQVGPWVYYLSSKGLCRTDGHNVQVISSPRIENFIDSTSSAYWNKAAAGVWKNQYWLAMSTDGVNNNRIIVYDTIRDRFFTPFTNRSISVFFTAIESNGEVLYGGEDQSYGTTYIFNQSGIFDEEMDQEYLTGQDADSAITAATTVRKAQSFQLSARVKITQVEAYLKKVSGTTTELTVRIETNVGGVPSGTLADTNATTTIAAITSTSYAWKEAEFATPFYLSASTTYWLVIQHTTEGSGDSAHAWGSDDTSPTYSDGSLASYASGAWTADADKDLWFRVYYQKAIEKYITTKGYYLGDPQFLKDVKKVFVDVLASGDWSLTVGVNTDLYDGFREELVDLSGNAPVRGSTLTRGSFIRGTQAKVKMFVKFQSLRGRMVKIRFYNNKENETFKLFGSTINYITRRLLR